MLILFAAFSATAFSVIRLNVSRAPDCEQNTDRPTKFGSFPTRHPCLTSAPGRFAAAGGLAVMGFGAASADFTVFTVFAESAPDVLGAREGRPSPPFRFTPLDDAAPPLSPLAGGAVAGAVG